VRVCFPLQTVAFRGHGFSLLGKTALWGLQTRAISAGVNGPPLQTTIVIVKVGYKHYCQTPCKRSVFPERYVTSQCISTIKLTTILSGGTSKCCLSPKTYANILIFNKKQDIS